MPLVSQQFCKPVVLAPYGVQHGEEDEHPSAVEGPSVIAA